MSNSFGQLFRITTWGESHGPAVGVVVDGCPPGLPLAVGDIQADLDRRRPGQSELVTPRQEADSVEILSGVFEGRTTGVPISLLVRNADQRPGAYDAAGNLTTAPQPFALTAGYVLTYDAWNRLVKIMNGSFFVASYTYDGANRRVQKTIPSSVVRDYYYSDQWQVVEERLGTAPTVADRRFVWGLRGVDDLVFRERITWTHEGGSSSSLIEVVERLYALDDPLNITAIINTSGAVQERYGYSAFGVPSYMNASFGAISGSSYDWETLYASYRYDTETGLYQVRNRCYHPNLGVWLTRDPIGYKGGIYLYAYVKNNSVNKIDPMGLLDPCQCAQLKAQSDMLKAKMSAMRNSIGSANANLAADANGPVEGSTYDQVGNLKENSDLALPALGAVETATGIASKAGVQLSGLATVGAGVVGKVFTGAGIASAALNIGRGLSQVSNGQTAEGVGNVANGALGASIMIGGKLAEDGVLRGAAATVAEAVGPASIIAGAVVFNAQEAYALYSQINNINQQQATIDQMFNTLNNQLGQLKAVYAAAKAGNCSL